MLQGLPIQELHYDERLTLMLSYLVDRANVGMAQSRGGTGFAAKPLESLGIRNCFRWQEFEGDETAEFYVLSLVNDAHAPAT